MLIDTINLTTVEVGLIKEIEEIYKAKNIVIVSKQDINFFLEQFCFIEESKEFPLNIVDRFLKDINTVLVSFLCKVNYFLCSIKLFNSEQVSIDFRFPNTLNSKIEDSVHRILHTTPDIELLIDEDSDSNTTFVSMIYTFHSVYLKRADNAIIDTSNINSMHYEESQKISAIDFLKEYEVDTDLIDDLHENASDIIVLLHKEDVISQDTMNSIIAILQKYVSLLYTTIEFEDIASILGDLATVFANLNLDEIDSSKKNMLNMYIEGLVNDLSSWANHIFIDADTPDIHYLDASLLENCSTIEAFVTSEPKSEDMDDDDDLEFF